MQRILEDHKKLLYPNCETDNKKLGTTLELLQWNAENGVSDKAFGKLLVKLKNVVREYVRSKEGCVPSRVRGAEDTCMPK